MALTTKYFSTAAAGSGDGSDWANRAALFTGGAWSTALTAHTFSSGNGLVALIGPGTHAITAVLQSSSFSAGAPSLANPLILHGCDGSGNPLTPPSPGWTSDMPDWDYSGLPEIKTSASNIRTIYLDYWSGRLLNFTTSSRNGDQVSYGTALDWCRVSSSVAENTGYGATVASIARVTNCLLSCTNATYASVANPSNAGIWYNNRITGGTGTAGPLRIGLSIYITATLIRNFIKVGGNGVVTDAGTGRYIQAFGNTITGCGGTGIYFNNTASQTLMSVLMGNLITDCGGAGVDARSAANVLAIYNRLRDNSGGDLINFRDNFPTSYNYTTAETADEYVDSVNGDYRVSPRCDIWQKGYGVGGYAAPTLAF